MTGMTIKEYEDKVREIGFYFMVAPAIILIGMAVSGSIIDTFLHTSNTFATLFSEIGGVLGIGGYYVKLFKEFTIKSEIKKQ